MGAYFVYTNVNIRHLSINQNILQALANGWQSMFFLFCKHSTRIGEVRIFRSYQQCWATT